MAIKTLEIKELEAKAANVYEAIVVLSKRSRQINEETKIEFQQRIENLVALPTTGDEMDEEISNPDQLKVSLEFEKRPKATDEAIDELMGDQLEHRYKEAEEKK
ncbi:MAG: DNA-directed RNA polymerase subunit omega [Bacteroidota bacterium]|nr:DNA-directed RNA polymerase subunit omega [Bacteroidota bacterium]